MIEHGSFVALMKATIEELSFVPDDVFLFCVKDHVDTADPHKFCNITVVDAALNTEYWDGDDTVFLHNGFANVDQVGDQTAANGGTYTVAGTAGATKGSALKRNPAVLAGD